MVIAGDHAILAFDSRPASGGGGSRRRTAAARGRISATCGRAGVRGIARRAGCYAVEPRTGDSRMVGAGVRSRSARPCFSRSPTPSSSPPGTRRSRNPPLGGVVAVERGSGRVRWRRAACDRRCGERRFRRRPGDPPATCWSPRAATGGSTRPGSRHRRGARALPGVTRPDGRAQDRDWRALALSGSTLIAGSCHRDRGWLRCGGASGAVAVRACTEGGSLRCAHRERRDRVCAASGRPARRACPWQDGRISDGRWEG